MEPHYNKIPYFSFGPLLPSAATELLKILEVLTDELLKWLR